MADGQKSDQAEARMANDGRFGEPTASTSVGDSGDLGTDAVPCGPDGPPPGQNRDLLDKKVKRGGFMSPAPGFHRDCDPECRKFTHDVILSASEKDRKLAFEIKEWIENTIYCDDFELRHYLKVEMLQNMDTTPYMKALHDAKTKARNIVLLVTKHSLKDERQNYVNLVAWSQKYRDDLNLIVLTDGLNDNDLNSSDNFSLANAFPIRYEPHEKHFIDTIQAKLTNTGSVHERLEHDACREKCFQQKRGGQHHHSQNHEYRHPSLERKTTSDGKLRPFETKVAQTVSSLPRAVVDPGTVAPDSDGADQQSARNYQGNSESRNNHQESTDTAVSANQNYSAPNKMQSDHSSRMETPPSPSHSQTAQKADGFSEIPLPSEVVRDYLCSLRSLDALTRHGAESTSTETETETPKSGKDMESVPGESKEQENGPPKSSSTGAADETKSRSETKTHSDGQADFSGSAEEKTVAAESMANAIESDRNETNTQKDGTHNEDTRVSETDDHKSNTNRRTADLKDMSAMEKDRDNDRSQTAENTSRSQTAENTSRSQTAENTSRSQTAENASQSQTTENASRSQTTENASRSQTTENASRSQTAENASRSQTAENASMSPADGTCNELPQSGNTGGAREKTFRPVSPKVIRERNRGRSSQVAQDSNISAPNSKEKETTHKGKDKSSDQDLQPDSEIFRDDQSARQPEDEKRATVKESDQEDTSLLKTIHQDTQAHGNNKEFHGQDQKHPSAWLSLEKGSQESEHLESQYRLKNSSTYTSDSGFASDCRSQSANGSSPSETYDSVTRMEQLKGENASEKQPSSVSHVRQHYSAANEGLSLGEPALPVSASGESAQGTTAEEKMPIQESSQDKKGSVDVEYCVGQSSPISFIQNEIPYIDDLTSTSCDHDLQVRLRDPEEATGDQAPDSRDQSTSDSSNHMKDPLPDTKQAPQSNSDLNGIDAKDSKEKAAKVDMKDITTHLGSSELHTGVQSAGTVIIGPTTINYVGGPSPNQAGASRYPAVMPPPIVPEPFPTAPPPSLSYQPEANRGGDEDDETTTKKMIRRHSSLKEDSETKEEKGDEKETKRKKNKKPLKLTKWLCCGSDKAHQAYLYMKQSLAVMVTFVLVAFFFFLFG